MSDRLPFTTWLDLRWTSFWNGLHRCPTCNRRPRRWSSSPRWDQDRIARMLGLPVEGHCPDCGKPYEGGAS